MDAVIVAAGRGTRMGPLTERRPKPLLPVGESTLLERLLDQCSDVVDRFVLVVGYRSEDVCGRIGYSHAGVPVEYVRQREPLGTAHAIGRAAEVVDDRFLACNADVLVEAELIEAVAAAEGTAMAVSSVADPSAYGVVETRDGQVAAVVEKPDDPPSDRVNTGIYAFEPTVFEYVARTDRSPRGEYELTDAVELMLADGYDVTAVETSGTWMDVGRPWDLLEATDVALADLESRRDGTIEQGAQFDGEVVVEAGARVRSGAYFEGPVVVGANAEVGPNASVRGPAVLGPDTHVGTAVEVNRSVLMAGASVGHHCYVGDSVLGADVEFGAGTTVANLRHDEAPVRMRVKGRAVDTGRRKLGVVVGDGTETGIDTSLNAGVIMDVDARTRPDECVLEDR